MAKNQHLSASSDLIAARKQAIIDELIRQQEEADLWVRYQVINNDRIDILCEEVLGYNLEDFHNEILKFQFHHEHGLILAPRGFGKTTIGTIARVVFEILKNPNISILLASRVTGNAEDILDEVSGHFVKNEKFIRIFGNLVGTPWYSRQITVANKTKISKEPTVNTIGSDSGVVGKHYDLVICDDLVDEENSRTEHMREHVRNWFYMSLYPTVKPGGRLWVVGTRYHFEDMYGHLLEHEFKNAYIRIPALNDAGISAWEDRFSTKLLFERKAAMGAIIFNAQYMNDVDMMKGEVFKHEWTKVVSTLPAFTKGTYMGIDLAIGEESKHDFYVRVNIGISEDLNIYVIDVLMKRLTFRKQTEDIRDALHLHDPVRTGIESNNYQRAQYQNVKAEEPDFIFVPIVMKVDKMTRAWRATKYFESGRVHFHNSVEFARDLLVKFPDAKGSKDLFDAIDMALTVAFRKTKRNVRPPEDEPGILSPKGIS